MLSVLQLRKSIVILMFMLGSVMLSVSAQTNSDTSAYITIKKSDIPLTVTFDKGIKFATKDENLFLMQFRFRMQNRIGFGVFEDGDEWDIDQVEARVRRLRVRFDGHMLTKKLEYHIQLSFSRADMDWDNSGVPNVLRDAYITYKFTPKFELIFGQTKLPGNRQRVISSGDQQFVDRSIVNATFTIDRDFGLMFKYKNKLGIDYVIKGAVSNGEGRNSNIGNAGICYSGRVELLPLGHFTDGGDYFESDLAREPSPKISIAAGASYNDLAVRTAGQLGKDMKVPAEIIVYHGDMLIKYNGWSSYTELMKRTSGNPIPDATNLKSFVHVGNGYMSQLGYLWKSNYELAFRYAAVLPDAEIYKLAYKIDNYSIGASKYIRKHNIKLQTDVTYETIKDLNSTLYKSNGFIYRLQFQIAI